MKSSSALRFRVSRPVLVGVLAGLVVGVAYEARRQTVPDASPVRAQDLAPPAGYQDAGPPSGVEPSVVAGSWESGTGADVESLVVLRLKGQPIDEGLLSRMRELDLQTVASLDPKVVRATIGRSAQRQGVAVVELTIGREGEPRRRVRHALVGGTTHLTRLEQVGPEARADESGRIFEALTARVAELMGRAPRRPPWANAVTICVALGVIVGRWIERRRQRPTPEAAPRK